MELTWLTKALLWLLNRRPDIGNIDVHEITLTDLSPDLDYLTTEEVYQELSSHLSPQQIKELHVDHLRDCWDQPSDNQTA